MELKHVALALNGAKGAPRRATLRLAEAGCSHAVKLLAPGVSTGNKGGGGNGQAEISAQAIAMLLNAISALPPASARGRESFATEEAQLFSAATAALMQMPETRFDAQSVATTLNALAARGVFEVSLFRYLARAAIRAPESGFSLQSAAMVLNSYARMLDSPGLAAGITSAWDVSQADVDVLEGLTVVVRRIAKEKHPESVATTRSVALIMNALSKVGIRQRSLFMALGRLLPPHPAQAGKPSSYDAQAVANILNALAKAGVRDEALVRRLGAAARDLPPAQFESQHIATILNAHVRLAIPAPELFAALANHLTRRLTPTAEIAPDLPSPQAVALILNAFSRAGMHDPPLFRAMSSVVQKYLVEHPSPSTEMSPQAVSSILNACANGGFRDPALLDALSHEAAGFPPGTSLQHIACAANALVRLGRLDPPLAGALAGAARAGALSREGPLPLALLLNAVARSDPGADPALFRESAQAAARIPAGDFTPQSLAMLANAYAKAGVRDHALFRRLADVGLTLPPEDWDEQSVANLLNAFAKHSQAWARHAAAAPEVWGKLVALFQKLAKTCVDNRKTAFSSQGVALVLNAFAKFGLRDEALFAHLSEVAQRFGTRNFELPCELQDVANILNAFAKAGDADAALLAHMSRVTQEFGAMAFEGDGAAIGVILNALARLRVRDHRLLARLSSVARDMEPSAFDAQAVSNVFHALALLGERDRPLLDHLASALLRTRQASFNAQDLNAQSVANLAWAAAALALDDLPLHNWIAKSVADALPSMDAACLPQVHQYIVAIELEGLVPADKVQALPRILVHRKRLEKAFRGAQREGVSKGVLRPADLEQMAFMEAAVDGEDTRMVHSAAGRGAQTSKCAVSMLQADVARTLQAVLAKEVEREAMGERSRLLRLLVGDEDGPAAVVEVVEEATEPLTGYSLDMAIAVSAAVPQVGSHALAVEVDGPTHFARGSRLPLGRTLMKRRQLRAAGVTAVSVPYWDWDASASEAAKRAVLEALLFAAARRHSSGLHSQGEARGEEAPGVFVELPFLKPVRRSLPTAGVSRAVDDTGRSAEPSEDDYLPREESVGDEDES